MNNNTTTQEELLAKMAEIQQQMAEIEANKAKALEAEKQALVQERKDLLENARKFRADAMTLANQGNLEKANTLRSFAEDAEKQAQEIVIEGEESVEVSLKEEIYENFGEALNLKKILLLLASITGVLYFLTGYINHRIEVTGTEISISRDAEWIHALLTTNFWALCWFVSFVMLYFTFRAISRFINPNSEPHFDFTSKLFTECTVQYQISISIILLLSFVFSWVLMYLHNPVSNAG